MKTEHKIKSEKNNPWFYSTLVLVGLIVLAATGYIAYKLGQNGKSNTIEISANTPENLKTANSNKSGSDLKNSSPLANQTEIKNLTSLPVPEDRKVGGEMYVVTKGRDNIKLATVNICAVSEPYINSWIARKKSEGAKKFSEDQKKVDNLRQQKAQYVAQNPTEGDILDTYDARMKLLDFDSNIRLAEAQRDYWKSPEYYLAGLVQCEFTAQTDSDGRYTINLPGDRKFALAATTSRRVFDSTETYWWLLWANGSTVNFNNETRMSANPQGSVTRIE